MQMKFRGGMKMIGMICTDEKNGMLFHHRRQSRDRLLCQDILQECQGKRLYMNAYSGAMFQDAGDAQIVISEDFLEQAGEGEYCFIENSDLGEYLGRMEALIVYRWNRRYPADTYLTADLSDGSWEAGLVTQFQGSSHERITKEVYKRVR